MRSIAVIIALLGTACWHDPPVVARAEPPATPLIGPCPDSVTTGFFYSNLWAHEIDPHCSPAPFEFPGIACEGNCPTPCRAVTTGMGATLVSTYTYVDGKLATIDGDHEPQAHIHEECRYNAGHLVACTNPRGTATVMRDPQGRIISVVSDEGTPDPTTLALTYDPRGELASTTLRDGFITTTMRYDSNHRLVREAMATRGTIFNHAADQKVVQSSLDYSYDDAGRLVHTELGDTRYHYSNGRLAQIERDVFMGNGLRVDTTSFEYDDHHRPRRILEVTRAKDLSESEAEDSGLIDRGETVYSYDCR